MFNLQGSEIIFILLIALVVLGPEKLPGAIRRAMRTYQELRKMGDGFQSEFRSAIDEPMREMRETAGVIKDQADPKKIAEDAEQAAHKAALKDAKRKEVVAEMHAAGERAQVADALAEADAAQGAGADEWADPVDDVSGTATDWGSPAGAPDGSLAPPPPSGPVTAPPGLPADPTATDEENAA